MLHVSFQTNSRTYRNLRQQWHVARVRDFAVQKGNYLTVHSLKATLGGLAKRPGELCGHARKLKARGRWARFQIPSSGLRHRLSHGSTETSSQAPSRRLKSGTKMP